MNEHLKHDLWDLNIKQDDIDELADEIGNLPQPGRDMSEQDGAICTAEAVSMLVQQLEGLGFSPASIAAGLHAQVAATLTCTFGGNEAALQMRAAADEVEGTPSLADELANMKARGAA